MKNFLLIAIIAATLSIAAVAQTGDEKNELSVWGGYSPQSTTAIGAIGRVPDARFGMVAFRYARRLHDGDSVKVRWTIDAVPAAFLSYPDLVVSGTPPVIRSVRGTRYAYGITPAGVQVNFRNKKMYQPFVDISAGLLIFQHVTPNFGGTKLNFTPAIGAGLEIARSNGTAVTVGYKALHISNANRGSSNPGFQNNLFYVGYTFHTW
ncbi:MAG TPA: acyloxyacyl hydrolase [Pyrinomonadaceae bacterium]|jgi:opacity protein-like surface antigen|nr:acyloxyacyl hydrolase [Pyrinomonadaceae bacterium]